MEADVGTVTVKVGAVMVWDGGDNGGLGGEGRGGGGVGSMERYGRAVEARTEAMRRMERVRRDWQ